jgi:hypothetical protein
MVDTNWGFTAGFQDAQQAQIDRAQKSQLFDMSMDIDRTKLAGAQLDLKERETALDNAKAIQKLQSSALSKLAFDPKMDPVDKVTSELQTMAEADIEGGFPIQGAELLKQSVVVAKDHAEIIGKQSDQKMKDAQYVANLASTIHDQESLDSAKMVAQADGHTLPPEVAHMRWDPVKTPQFLKQLQDATTTQMQKLQQDKEKASTALTKVQTRKDEAEIVLDKAKTRAEVALAESREKNAGIAGGPSKEDIAAAYEAVKGEFGKGVTKEAAQAASLPVAERVAQLVKTMPRSQAVARAIQEEKSKPDSKLSGLSKPPPEAEAGVGMIDDLLGLLDKAQSQNKRITGIPGMARRVVKEDILGTVGITDDTIANDFEAQLTALHTELPALLLKSKTAGYFSKLKAEKMAMIARGLSPGDNINTTRSSLLQLRAELSGESGKEAQQTKKSDAGKFNAGERYVDANGNAAIYMGNGQWQPTK